MWTCRKTKCKVQLLLQPVIKDINNPVNQSKLEEDDVREARENLCKRVTIVLGNDEMVRSLICKTNSTFDRQRKPRLSWAT